MAVSRYLGARLLVFPLFFFHSDSIAKDIEYSIYPPVPQQIPTYSEHLTCLHQHTHIPIVIINVVYQFYVVDLNGLFCFSSCVYISSVMQMDENKLMQTIENCAWFMWILLSRCDGFSYFFFLSPIIIYFPSLHFDCMLTIGRKTALSNHLQAQQRFW